MDLVSFAECVENDFILIDCYTSVFIYPLTKFEPTMAHLFFIDSYVRISTPLNGGKYLEHSSANNH